MIKKLAFLLVVIALFSLMSCQRAPDEEELGTAPAQSEGAKPTQIDPAKIQFVEHVLSGAQWELSDFVSNTWSGTVDQLVFDQSVSTAYNLKHNYVTISSISPANLYTPVYDWTAQAQTLAETLLESTYTKASDGTYRADGYVLSVTHDGWTMRHDGTDDLDIDMLLQTGSLLQSWQYPQDIIDSCTALLEKAGLSVQAAGCWTFEAYGVVNFAYYPCGQGHIPLLEGTCTEAFLEGGMIQCMYNQDQNEIVELRVENIPSDLSLWDNGTAVSCTDAFRFFLGIFEPFEEPAEIRCSMYYASCNGEVLLRPIYLFCAETASGQRSYYAFEANHGGYISEIYMK